MTDQLTPKDSQTGSKRHRQEVITKDMVVDAISTTIGGDVEEIDETKRSHSELLTVEDNRRVDQLIGKGFRTGSTTVATLYRSRPPGHKKWYEQVSGVVCLVHNCKAKCSYIKLYDMDQQLAVFDHKLHQTFHFNQVSPTFYQFWIPDASIGLRFADRDEAKQFVAAVHKCRKHLLFQ